MNFVNVARTSRKKVPFGIAQAGKAFRNEITPKNFIFRTREFEQMEIEYFCEPGTDGETFQLWHDEAYRFYTEILGLKKESVRFVEIPKDGLPHYSKRAGDFEFAFPFGWGEITTLANRTDFDLKAHMEHSKADLSYVTQVTEGDQQVTKKYIPYVIEPSMGLSRLTLATLCNAYDEVPTEEGKRIVLRFQPNIAPVKVAVLPVVKKLSKEAGEVYKIVSAAFVSEYDEAGAIGKRYYRADEAGIPYAICVDGENFALGQVTIRDRDTGLQDTVKLDDLVDYLRKKGC